jgi:uncharacterized protein
MMDAGLQVSETPEGLTVRLHVLPRAKRSEIAGLHNGALKLKVTAPPVDDAANRAIVEFFSELLGVSKSNLKILSGNKSREKVLQIKSVSLIGFMARMPNNVS